MTIRQKLLRCLILIAAVVVTAKLLRLELSYYISGKLRGQWQRYGDLNHTSTTLLSSSRNRMHKYHGSYVKGSENATWQSQQQYSRMVVIPRMSNEDVSWIGQELPDVPFMAYVVDNVPVSRPPSSPPDQHHPPKNKGHEVMVYLSFIIEHYDELPDVIVFMHAHRWSHHNNEILGFDASEMIRRLNPAYVVRQGYVNLRCHWAPGCPAWLHANSKEESMGKQEEAVLSQCWRELFPNDPLPSTLSQPCCAQFALSRTAIRSIPLSRFVYYRDWILRTPLSDYISGRIWEYSWQYLFSGHNDLCPAEHLCYCDAFGVCFGGPTQYQSYQDTQRLKEEYQTNLKLVRQSSSAHGIISTAAAAVASASASASAVTITDTTIEILPEESRVEYMEHQISALNKELEARKLRAIERGRDPRLRAVECGREWTDGDGF